MNADDFREIALQLPDAKEQQHMNHPDFRVGGKIFATLGPDEDWAGLKLSPEQQAGYLDSRPDAFKPANGAWGRGGFTIVTLEQVDREAVELAVIRAWRNTAPKKSVEKFETES